jgi:hypothetical protein
MTISNSYEVCLLSYTNARPMTTAITSAKRDEIMRGGSRLNYYLMSSERGLRLLSLIVQIS